MFQKKFMSCGLFVAVMLFAFNLGAQDGWGKLKENKWREAIAEFAKIITSSTDEGEKSRAYIGKMLAEEQAEMNGHPTFKMFFNNTTNPFPYTYALWHNYSVTLGGGKLTSDQIMYMKSIMEKLKDNSYLYGMANVALADHYESSNQHRYAAPFLDKVGVIKKWQLLGEFENISGSGFNKDFGAVENARASHRFRNKYHADVTWFSPWVYPTELWLRFGNHFYASNSIMYAQTFCDNPTEREVILNIGNSGSLKVWVNDVLIFSEETERNNDIDTYKMKFKLPKGKNRILLQIGESEAGSANFACRITDDNNMVINDITFTEEYQEDYNKTLGSEVEILEHPYEVYFINKIKEGKNDFLYKYLLIETYLHNDKVAEARSYLKDLEQEAGNSILVQELKAQIYLRDDNSTDLSKVIEKLEELDPTGPYGLSLKFDEFLEQEEYEKAQEIIETIEKRTGKTEEVYEMMIELASEQNEIEKLLSLADKAYASFPENPGFVVLKYDVEVEGRQNLKAGYKVVKKFLKTNYDGDVKDKELDYYIKTNNIEKALNEIHASLSLNPASTGTYALLARVHFALGKYEMAADYIEEALKLAPYIGYYHKVIADSYYETMERLNEAGGNQYLAQNIAQLKGQVMDSYRKAIEYNPFDYEARERLTKLEGKTSLFENFKKYEPETMLADAPKAEDYPEDNSYIMLYENQRIIYAEGASEERNYVMIKVFNTAGVDNWKEYSLPVSRNESLNVIEAKVFKENGTKLDAEVNYNFVVFTDLEPGDIIYIESKKQSYYSGKLAENFWDNHFFTFYYPAKRSAYNLLVHNSKEFDYKVHNSDMKPVIEEIDDYKMYSWAKDSIEPYRSEPYMPRTKDAGEILHISSFKSWSEISAWYADLSSTKAKVDFEVKEAVKEIFEGKENLTEIEKAKVIYDYITKNIRYSSISFRQSGLIPQRASKVINTKLGDCKDVSTLFVAMGKEVGLDASLVLINTRDNGDYDLLLPSIEFNHCIAKVNIENKPYYVELTSDKNPFSSFGYSLRGASSLDIVPNSSLRPLDPNTRVMNTITRKTSIHFEGSDVMVSKDNTATGVYAANKRATYKDVGEEKRRKEMQEGVSKFFVEAELKDLSFDDNINTTEEQVTYQYSFEAKNVLNDLGGIYVFKVPMSEKWGKAKFLSTKDRDFDINLWEYDITDQDHEIIEIDMPADKKLIKKPEDISMSNKYFDYSLMHTLNGNKLTIIRKLKVKQSVIPAEEYSEFKTEFEKVVKADDKQIAFQ